MDIIAYTDGSYKQYPEAGAFYSGAAIIITDPNKNPHVLTTVGADPRYLGLRNVGGEIAAVVMACEYCLNTLHVTESDNLLIVHDYVGIRNWCLKKGDENYWKAKNPTAQFYRDYMNTKVKTRCRVMFQWVQGHSSSVGNGMADQYAKQAMQNYVANLRGK